MAGLPHRRGFHPDVICQVCTTTGRARAATVGIECLHQDERRGCERKTDRHVPAGERTLSPRS